MCMIVVNENTNYEEIEKLHHREKVLFHCTKCGKEQIENAQGVWIKLKHKRLFCKGCNVLYKRDKTNKYIPENTFINSIDELEFITHNSKNNRVKFICEVCGEEKDEMCITLKNHDRLICGKCYHEYRCMKRFGVKSYLSIAQKIGSELNHTEGGIFKSRMGIVRHLWYDQFDKRIESLDRFGWQFIDVDWQVGTMLIRRKCCGEYKKFLMGTEDPLRMRCKCNKKYGEPKSYQEETLFLKCKELFPQYTITSGKRGWNKFRENNTKGNFEIDIFFEELNFGIEFNGIFWHNKANQKRELDKVELAKKNGIKVINIWEDDWKSSPNQCIEYIKNVVGDINGGKNS